MRSHERRYRQADDRLVTSTKHSMAREALRTCGTSNKLAFRSRAAAAKEAIAIKARGRFVGPLMTAYQCRDCRDWHLTSRRA